MEVKDGGGRVTFDTGYQREPDTGRGRYDLISPFAMRRLALRLEGGAAKYHERNWEKGGPISRNINSTIRHMMEYMSGDRQEDHLAAAMFNIMAIMHNETMIRAGRLDPKYDDIPRYEEINNGTQPYSVPGPDNISHDERVEDITKGNDHNGDEELCIKSILKSSIPNLQVPPLPDRVLQARNEVETICRPIQLRNNECSKTVGKVSKP